MQDASFIMQLLLSTQTEWNDLPEDDPQVCDFHTKCQGHNSHVTLIVCSARVLQLSYMISAWARLCKIMGKEFEQYLPLVMGPVLKAAQIKPEVAVISGTVALSNYDVTQH